MNLIKRLVATAVQHIARALEPTDDLTIVDATHEPVEDEALDYHRAACEYTEHLAEIRASQVEADIAEWTREYVSSDWR